MLLNSRHGASLLSGTRTPADCPAQLLQQVSAARHKLQARSRRSIPTCAIYIDRRQHMELAWKRQAAQEALLAAEAATSPAGVVTAVQDMPHLEHLLARSGSSLVVLCFYSRSCGSCKQALACFEELCHEAKAQQVRCVFAKHNIINDFDDVSDVARWYKVRAVPSFIFFDEGAVVRRVTMRDVRRLAGVSATIQQAMVDDVNHLKNVFREVVFRRAPGARA